MSPSLCFLQHLLSNKHGWWWPYKKCRRALEMLCHGRIPIGARSRAKSGKSEQRFSYKWWKFKNATACWQRIWKMLNKLAVHCLGLNPIKVINKIVLGGRYWVIPIYSQGKTPFSCSEYVDPVQFIWSFDNDKQLITQTAFTW